MATQAENTIDYAVLTSGGFIQPSATRSSSAPASASKNSLRVKRMLSDAIGRHRQEHPEHFISECKRLSLP